MGKSPFIIGRSTIHGQIFQRATLQMEKSRSNPQQRWQGHRPGRPQAEVLEGEQSFWQEAGGATLPWCPILCYTYSGP